MKCPCQDCKNRYKKIDSNGNVISTCHAECPLYKKYDEENKKRREENLKKNLEVGYLIETMSRLKRKR